MKKQELNLSLKFYVCLIAALTISDGQDIVYHKCRDVSISESSSPFKFGCDGGKIIIVKSAVIGATDQFNPPNQCPITNNTCLMETTIPADLCTGRNSCDINQNILLANESKLPCSFSNGGSVTVGNLIDISYICIIPGANNYGDICHFDGGFHSNDVIYISSYPNFPDIMGPKANYQCSCMFTFTSSSSSASVSIRVLLVKLTGAFTTCSERLSIFNLNNDTGLTFCSPCSNANNVTTITVASNIVILFQRDSIVSPYNGKFILEITDPSRPSGGGSMGSIRCGLVDSTTSSSTSISARNPSYTSTTTTSTILSQPSSFSSTNAQNTSLGSTMKSSSVSYSTQQITPSSMSTASNTQNVALLSSTTPSNSYGRPTPAGQAASEQKSISTGGIIGIVLGSAGLIAIVIIVLLCLLRKKRQHHDHRNGNSNFKIPKSLTVVQNLHRTSKIEFDDAASSELHTFQSAEHLSSEPQTRGYENNSQRKDDYVSNYEEGAPVPHIYYGPGMIPANQRRRLNDKMADNLSTETQSRNYGDDDVTLVENKLYGESEATVTNATTSSDYDVVRPDASSSDYDVAKPVATSSDYDVVRPVATCSEYDVERPVVQDGRTNESVEVDRGYAQTQNSSSDHSYYNVPIGTRVQPSAEVSRIEATNPVHEADSDVVLIDNTLYGSMLSL